MALRNRSTGILVTTSQKFFDEGFAAWFDNCLFTRGVHEQAFENFQSYAHLSPIERINKILPKFHRLTSHLQLKQLSTDDTIIALEKCYQHSKLPNSNLKWIDETDIRVIVLMWHQTPQLTSPINPIVMSNYDNAESPQEIHRVDQILKPLHSLPYIQSQPSTKPRSEKEYREALKNFYQLWEAPLYSKLSSLQMHLRIEESIFKYRKSFNWLDAKNAEQIEWASNYIQNGLNENFPYVCFDGSQKLILIVLIFDRWFADDAQKELFLIKMRKAWSIKKFRDKNKSKKSFNFLLDRSIEKQLNDLASRTGLSKNKIIEQCVRDAHKNTPKQGSKKIESTISNQEIPSDFGSPNDGNFEI